MKINYVQGDATLPIGNGRKIVAHVCNDVGGWGAGFVLAVSIRWPIAEREYRRWWAEGRDTFQLGTVQFVDVPHEPISVANMIAQRGIGGPRPLRYDALAECLSKVAEYAATRGATVHMPRIGTGLAGGKWDLIEPIIIGTLIGTGIAVTVYDLP